MTEGNRDQRLYQVINQQAGYFTAAQARRAGYSRRQLSYYADRGRWTRVRRGIYRLVYYPNSPHEDLIQSARPSVPSRSDNSNTVSAL